MLTVFYSYFVEVQKEYDTLKGTCLYVVKGDFDQIEVGPCSIGEVHVHLP